MLRLCRFCRVSENDFALLCVSFQGEKCMIEQNCSLPCLYCRGSGEIVDLISYACGPCATVLHELRVARLSPTRRRRFSWEGVQRKVSRAVSGRGDSAFMVDLLGYSVDDLRVHLERQFERGMSWSNYAGGRPDWLQAPEKFWHIDHIVPKSRFKRNEIRLCYALSNLRPLYADANMQKAKRREFLI